MLSENNQELRGEDIVPVSLLESGGRMSWGTPGYVHIFPGMAFEVLANLSLQRSEARFPAFLSWYFACFSGSTSLIVLSFVVAVVLGLSSVDCVLD